jgi:hypothetical protein
MNTVGLCFQQRTQTGAAAGVVPTSAAYLKGQTLPGFPDARDLPKS